MFTVGQLVAHAVGDYVLQSDWMATEKTKRLAAAASHVALYGMVFVFCTRNPIALALIVGTHFIIDRWRLARYVCWAKNFLAPKDAMRWVLPKIADMGMDLVRQGRNPPWVMCSVTGYPTEKPPFLAVWLMIITDNVMHVLCNGLAIHLFQ